MRGIRSLIIWIGLLVCLLVGLCRLPGLVICLERNGQVSLESAINGVCSDAIAFRYAEQDSRLQSAPTELSACQHCADVPITMGVDLPVRENLEFHSATQDIAPVKTPTIVSRYLAWATKSLLPQPPPTRPGRHRFLNTVILLI